MPIPVGGDVNRSKLPFCVLNGGRFPIVVGYRANIQNSGIIQVQMQRTLMLTVGLNYWLLPGMMSFIRLTGSSLYPPSLFAGVAFLGLA